MKSLLALIATLMLAGCVTLPDFDGTSRDTPAVDEYKFTVFLSTYNAIQHKCRNKSFVNGQLVFEENLVPVDACAITARYEGYYDTEIYIEPPPSKDDAYWWGTLFEELAHPLFDWRH